MKIKILHLTAALLGLLAGSHAAMAQGTAFTYQGELSDGGNPANGTYVFRGTLFDAATNGAKVRSAGSATVPVTDGRFTITLDPGAGVFTGAPRWLEIDVRTNAPALPIVLSPRQLITVTPYATFASGADAAGLLGTIATANIASGTITANLLATGAVASNQLAAGAVTANKLGPDVGLWSVIGGNIFRASGGVGIGVANPSAALHLNGGMKLNGLNTLEFGAGVAGKELSAGKIGYQIFTSDALDIVGAGSNPTNRQIKFWAEGGATFAGGADFNGTITAPSATIPNLGGSVAVNGSLTSIGGIKLNGVNTLEFGAEVAGKEPSAGKMGYEVFGPGALDIVGAGTNVALRQIRFWAEGGAQFMGAVSAASANIPNLNGNVTVNGEMTANVVTVTGGSDVAEPYHVSGAADVSPIAGMVVTINPDRIGQMRVASRAYDKTVAGILSGANGIAPGITLRQAGTIADGALPVASIGRVWCYCDADANGPIEAGDLLTTSNTPGHAMKVVDCQRANGSIVGKAMSPLSSGRGLVLVFVSLK